MLPGSKLNISITTEKVLVIVSEKYKKDDYLYMKVKVENEFNIIYHQEYEVDPIIYNNYKMGSMFVIDTSVNTLEYEVLEKFPLRTYTNSLEEFKLLRYLRVRVDGISHVTELSALGYNSLEVGNGGTTHNLPHLIVKDEVENIEFYKITPYKELK